MQVKYFGEIADIVGKTMDDIELKNASLFELVSYLKTEHKIAPTDIHIAVNHEMTSKEMDLSLKETDEIAILSPFAGG